MDEACQIIAAFKKGTRCALLRGAAGTGKTTLVRDLVPKIAAEGFSVCLLAPTGRAAKVLALRVERTASTIHSAIYEPPTDPKWDDKLECWRWFFNLKGEIPCDCVIIVDEASMVGQAHHADETLVFGSGSLLEDLLVWSGMKVPECRNRLLFVGDPYQLSPVGDPVGSPPALNPAKIAELLGEEPFVIELKTVHRQAKGSGILDESMRLRAALVLQDFGLFSFKEHADVRFLEEDKVLSAYHPEIDLDRKMIVAHTNERVWHYNQAVRTLLNRPSQLPVSGERLLSLRNTEVASTEEDVSFRNGDLLQAISIGDREVKLDGFYTIPGTKQNLHFAFTFHEISVVWINEPDRTEVKCWMNTSPITSESWRANDKYAYAALYGAILKNLKDKRHEDLQNLPVDKRREMIRDLIKRSVLLRAPVVTFGYALTVHKAQGGDWREVWVDCRYSGRQNNEDYFRWAYTAITRAKERLVLVEAPEIDDLVTALSRGIDKQLEVGGNVAASPQRPTPVAKTLAEALGSAGFALNRQEEKNWVHRCYIGRIDDSCAECGWVDVGYNGKGLVSNVSVHVSDLEEIARESLLALKGLPEKIVMGTEVAPKDEEPILKVFPQHQNVAERILAAAKDRLNVLSAMSMSPYQLRVSLRTELGDGYVDWFFNGKGQVTEMGNATLSVQALEILREGLKGGN